MLQPHFDGRTYSSTHDHKRLTGQLAKVLQCMKDGQWRTFSEISQIIDVGSEASISARLRDLRKDKFGGWEVERRARGDRSKGLFEYRVLKKV